MGAGRAFLAGTVLSVAVTAAWSWTATMTIGTGQPLHLNRDLLGDYAQVAGAATGNGPMLFAVTAGIYFACFLVSGLRQRRRSRAAAALRTGALAEAEPFSPQIRSSLNVRQPHPPRPGLPGRVPGHGHARLPARP